MASKDVKNRIASVRFGEATGLAIDRLRKLFTDKGEDIGEAELIRRLVDDGAARLIARNDLGLHEDLQNLRRNPRWGLLNIQTRQRAGEGLTRAEMVFLADFLVAAYKAQGLRGRGWVNATPVAALYKALFIWADLLRAAGNLQPAARCTELWERWGREGVLAVTDAVTGPKGQKWVSPVLAATIAERLAEVIDVQNAVDMHQFDARMGLQAKVQMLRVGLYGYWSSNQASVLGLADSEWAMPIQLTQTKTENFLVSPLQVGQSLTCSIDCQTRDWVFGFSNWVEWVEFHEVVSIVQADGLSARAGRFSLMKTNFDETRFYLDVSGVRLGFTEATFSELMGAIDRSAQDPRFLALAQSLPDIYGL